MNLRVFLCFRAYVDLPEHKGMVYYPSTIYYILQGTSIMRRLSFLLIAVVLFASLSLSGVQRAKAGGFSSVNVSNIVCGSATISGVGPSDSEIGVVYGNTNAIAH